MNSIIEEVYPLFELYQNLRSQMMVILADGDLDFTPGGDNIKLGELCRKIGEIDYSYIQSFKAFKQDFGYRKDDGELEGSVSGLMTWYQELDQDLRKAVESLSQDDIENRVIDRGPDFKVPPLFQLEVYKEALLIFLWKEQRLSESDGQGLTTAVAGLDRLEC
jgi:hypothetical protein